MEEDIKILENVLKTKQYGLLEVTDKFYEAIEELLKAYKELKEIEENHRKENGELREQVKELEEDLTSVYLKGIYDERDKRIALVKEKIEEINKAYEDSKDENGESQYYYPDYTIRVLEELLEKRK